MPVFVKTAYAGFCGNGLLIRNADDADVRQCIRVYVLTADSSIQMQGSVRGIPV